MDVTSILESYFDNLASAATNDKAVLDKLVHSNATLSASNADLVTTVKKLTSKNEELQ